MNYRLGSTYALVTALLLSTQEPFSFPAAKQLNIIQFVFLTQVALLVSLPLLIARQRVAVTWSRCSGTGPTTGSSESCSLSE
jgi:hypothetical protein